MPRPPPGDLQDPGVEPESLVSPALAAGFFTTRAAWEAQPYQVEPSFTDEKTDRERSDNSLKDTRLLNVRARLEVEGEFGSQV